MVYFRILLLVFVFAGRAQAQNARPVPAVASIASTNNYTQSDTLNAVRKLFDRRRAGGWFYVGSKVTATAALSATALLVLESNPIGLGIVGAGIGVGIGKLIRFSRKREVALINAYEQGAPLPQPIRRRLKRKFFGKPLVASE